jgi:hypothetical protein
MKNNIWLPEGYDWAYNVLDCSPPTGLTVDDPLPLPIGSEDFGIKGIVEYADGHFETLLDHFLCYGKE